MTTNNTDDKPLTQDQNQPTPNVHETGTMTDKKKPSRKAVAVETYIIVLREKNKDK